MPSALAPLDSPKMPETRIIPQKAKSTLSTFFRQLFPKTKGRKKEHKDRRHIVANDCCGYGRAGKGLKEKDPGKPHGKAAGKKLIPVFPEFFPRGLSFLRRQR